jgi:hypothetical protein
MQSSQATKMTTEIEFFGTRAKPTRVFGARSETRPQAEARLREPKTAESEPVGRTMVFGTEIVSKEAMSTQCGPTFSEQFLVFARIL